MVKKILIIFGLIFFFPTSSFAAQEKNIPTQVQEKFEQKVQTFYPKIHTAARNILFSLATIQLVLTFGFMAMRGELELGGIFAQFVKTILIVGFFLFVLDSPQYLKSIYQGFDKLGVSAGGNSASMDNITNQFYGMWRKIYDSISITEPFNSLIFVLVGLVASVALLSLVGNALMFYAFTIFSIYVGIFWIGFGTFDQTRPWAINAISNVIRWGAKWMMVMLLMSVTFSLVSDVLSPATADDLDSMISLLIVSVLMVSINNGLSSFIDSYFTGSGGGDNNRGMQMLSAGAGAVAGAGAGFVAGAMASPAVQAAKETNPDGKAGIGTRFAGAMNGAVKGGFEGAEKGAGGTSASVLSGNWAKEIFNHKNNSTNPYSFQSPATPSSDGDVGGGIKDSFAEPKVGGEINPNQSDKS